MRPPRGNEDGQVGNFKGVFDVREPSHLVQKLESDLERMCRDPMNVYPFIDFFITADNIVDWLHPTKAEKHLRDELRSQTLLAVCSHLANGAKHFEAERHHVVKDIEQGDGDFSSDFNPEDFSADHLVVEVGPSVATELGIDEKVDGRLLSEKVLEYWKASPLIKKKIPEPPQTS
jgi:hypothetical protein